MEKEVYAPVVIPTCNRYEHLKNCIESLGNCTYAEKTELYISIDYPPNESYVQGWHKVKEYVESIKGFKDVHVWLQEHNLGIGVNGNFVLDKAFEKNEYLIFTEDDNIFAPAFLDYMNKMLKRFEKDPHVYSIAGFSMLSLDYHSKICKNYAYQPWGNGKWRDKWYSLCSLDVAQIYEKYSRKLSRIIRMYFDDKWTFCRYTSFLLRGANGISLNDTTLTILFYLLGYYTIYPTKSLVKNNGFDGTGYSCVTGAVPHIDEIELGKEPFFNYDEGVKIPISKELQFPIPEWVKRSSKFKQDPLSFILYYIMGRENYIKWRKRKGF